MHPSHLPRFCLAWCLAFCPFIAGSACAADDPVPVKADSPAPITFDVTVALHNGSPIPGLTKEDFTVLDNGKAQDIVTFRADYNDANQTKVILVLDAINMKYDRAAFAKQQIIQYLKSNDGHLEYPTALAVVTDTGVNMQGIYTADGKQLAQDLEKFDVGLRVIRESAGFNGASERLGTSIRSLQQVLHQAGTVEGRKLLIWVSPGWAMMTGPSVRLDLDVEKKLYAELMQFSYVMRDTRTVLSAVDPSGANEAGTFHSFYYRSFLKPVKKPTDASFGNLSLQVLAISSGGTVLNSSNDVAGLIQNVVKQSTPSYTLSFIPSPADGPNEFHAVEIKVDKPGSKAQARWGYYTGH